MQFVVLILLAIATSLDSLGVGVAYGLSGTRVRLSAHFCIGTIMMAITWTAVACGNQLSRFLPDLVTRALSAVFFVGVGIWILLPLMRKALARKRANRASASDRSGELPADGRHTPTFTEVLDNPQLADLDSSRDIDLREAGLLGVALSLNNIGGGVSAGMIRITPLAMASWSVFFNVVCLVGGHLFGSRLSGTRIGQHAQALSGMLMILIGLYELKGG